MTQLVLTTFSHEITIADDWAMIDILNADNTVTQITRTGSSVAIVTAGSESALCSSPTTEDQPPLPDIARLAPAKRSGRSMTRSAAIPPQPAANPAYDPVIRAWARDNGHSVSSAGRLSASIIRAYQAAQAPALSAVGPVSVNGEGSDSIDS
jgi:Lsr2